MKLSAIIIAKNEQDLIRGVLDSIKFCDEIILIDNDSEDNTAQIAKDRGAKVFKNSTNDFSELRNKGAEEASGDFLFYIDCDERVSLELRENILKAASHDDGVSAYKILRKNYYFGNNEWPKIERMERLFKKSRFRGWYGKIHESPKFDGEVALLEGYLLHFTHRDLTQMLNKTIEWSSLEAQARFNANHPKIKSWRIFRVMLTSFLSSFIKDRGIRAGSVGILESIYQSFSTFITYAKLWELQEKDKKTKEGN